MTQTDLSKFLSYILRHQPESIGLKLDAEGWAIIDDLINAAVKNGHDITIDNILDVVQSSDKKRFTISQNGL